MLRWPQDISIVTQPSPCCELQKHSLLFSQQRISTMARHSKNSNYIFAHIQSFTLKERNKVQRSSKHFIWLVTIFAYNLGCGHLDWNSHSDSLLHGQMCQYVKEWFRYYTLTKNTLCTLHFTPHFTFYLRTTGCYHFLLVLLFMPSNSLF